jgi:hypothetical protein
VKNCKGCQNKKPAVQTKKLASAGFSAAGSIETQQIDMFAKKWTKKIDWNMS